LEFPRDGVVSHAEAVILCEVVVQQPALWMVVIGIEGKPEFGAEPVWLIYRDCGCRFGDGVSRGDSMFEGPIAAEGVIRGKFNCGIDAVSYGLIPLGHAVLE